MEADHSDSGYNGFFTKEGNYIWAGAMCLAWRELSDKIIKEPIELQSKSEAALKIIENYNNPKFLRKDIKESAIYVKSGFGDKTIELINAQLPLKFPKQTIGAISGINLADDEFIAYAYIYKNFPFFKEFTPRPGKDFRFLDQKVKSFYAKTEQQKKNVFHFYYKDPLNFLIGVKGKNQGEKIYFLKTEDYEKEDPAKVVDKVIKQVIHHEKKGCHRYLSESDRFEMPMVHIKANRNIKEIEGLHFKNKGFKNFYLAKAIEGFKLDIDQKGAVMENVAILAGKRAKKKTENPKIFELNRPFWIIMKESQKHPYMCVKINSIPQ